MRGDTEHAGQGRGMLVRLLDPAIQVGEDLIPHATYLMNHPFRTDQAISGGVLLRGGVKTNAEWSGFGLS